MAILSNIVPCNGGRLIIHGGVHPIAGDLGVWVSHVGHGRSQHATGPNSVATLTEASSMVGASTSWRIEVSGDAVSVGGEFDMVGGC
eukprot:scaffold91519_cov62-Attheya_sp.AAC.4